MPAVLSTGVGLLVHAAAFALGVAFGPALPTAAGAAWPWLYAGGALVLLLGHWRPRWRPSAALAAQLTWGSVLLAVVFWGAGFALDVLGNAIPHRLPPSQRVALPLPLVLAPGVASVGAGAWVAAVLRRHCAVETPGGEPS